MKTIKSVNVTSFVIYGAVLVAFWTFVLGLYYWILGWLFGAQSIWIDMNLSYIDSLDSTDYPKKGYYGKIGYSRRNKDFYFSISAQQMQKDYAVDMGNIYEDDFYGWNINSYYSKDIFITVQHTQSVSRTFCNIGESIYHRLFRPMSMWMKVE